MKKEKCHKCKKPVLRNKIYEKNAGTFHKYCWEKWKIKKLRKEVDKTWQLKGLECWGRKCICGKYAPYCHHFFFKNTYPNTRYDIDNAVPICPYCHTYIHSQDPKVFDDKIKEHRGEEWYQRLKSKATDKKLPLKNISYYKKVEINLKSIKK